MPAYYTLDAGVVADRSALASTIAREQSFESDEAFGEARGVPRTTIIFH
jgi:hypothetical protein